MSKRGPMPRRRTAGEFETVRQVRGAHRAAGGRWFDDLKRLTPWGVRVHSGVLHGRYFVTEQFVDANRPERRWTLHEILPDGDVRVAGEWYAYGSAQEAHAAAAAREASKGGEAR